MGRRANGEGSIFQRVDGLWCARLKLESGKRWQCTGRTQAVVLAKLRVAQSTVDQARPLQHRQQRITVAGYLSQWLEEVARPRIKPGTYVSYAEIVRLHLAPEIGKLRLDKLEARHVQRLLNIKTEQGLSPRRVQYIHTVLKGALKTAVRWELAPRNVATLVDSPRVPESEIQPLGLEQGRLLLETARGHQYGNVYALLLSTGLRLGEALALRWSDVDLDSSRLRVRHTLERLTGQPWRLTEPKSVKGQRLVPLIGTATTALRAERADQLARKVRNRDIWQDHDLVFTNEIGEPFSVSAVGHAFKHILKKAGLPSTFRTHDLRHTAATYLTAAGVPSRTIMEILGHSTIVVTQRYQHVLDSMLDDAGSRLESFFPAQQHTQAS